MLILSLTLLIDVINCVSTEMDEMMMGPYTLAPSAQQSGMFSDYLTLKDGDAYYIGADPADGLITMGKL
jgi:hypothetical protein